MPRLLPLALAILSLACSAPRSTTQYATRNATRTAPAPTLDSIAVRVHHMDAMVRFYEELFGVHFEPVDTFGLASQFGQLDGRTLKFVPLRAGPDFEEYPSHQLGLVVADVRATRARAVELGGRLEGDLLEQDGRTHGAVRDPDGNTLELYERR